jgi:hypothetical protein
MPGAPPGRAVVPIRRPQRPVYAVPGCLLHVARLGRLAAARYTNFGMGRISGHTPLIKAPWRSHPLTRTPYLRRQPGPSSKNSASSRSCSVSAGVATIRERAAGVMPNSTSIPFIR